MDFLKNRSNEAIKRELRSIRESYHHYWDPLAELLQNSRDAIERARQAGSQGPHFISVAIDASKRLIEVTDNGVGISKGKIQEALAPGGGDKTDRTTEVGEKGVGLTYAIFTAGDFEIETRTAMGGSHGGRVKGARDWLESQEPQAPPQFVELNDNELSQVEASTTLDGHAYPTTTLTRIRIGALPPPKDDQDLFALTAQQLTLLLRTRTAIGVTHGLHNDGFVPSFGAHYRFDLAAGKSSGTLDVGYPAPHTYVAKDKVEELTSVQAAFVTRNDEKRSKYLSGKTVWGRKQIRNGDETISVYGVMFPGNSAFSELGKTVLGVRLDDSTTELKDELFRSGIFVATKSMPTGVEIPAGPGGQYPAYYRRCLFVVESDSILFDMGRKSMHWKPQRRLQDAVSKLFGEFENIAPYQSDERVAPGAGAQPILSKAERDARKKADWARFRNLVDLKVPKIPYAKVPNKQEAPVAAVFHQLIGAGILKNYRPLATGYSAQYDLHTLYDQPGGKELELVIEFKYTLEALVKDLEDGRKNFDDIHMLVAWTADEQKLKNAKFDLSRVNQAKVIFQGVTHELSLPTPGVDPIPVILLEFLVRTLE